MVPFKKELLKSGDNILVHTKGFLSFFSIGIRMLTESFWNHAAKYVEEVDGKGYFIEALGGGVKKTPIEEYLDNKKYILKATRLKKEAFKDEEEYSLGLRTSRERLYIAIGTKYDWWAVIFLGFKYIIKGYYKEGRKYIPLGNPLQKREEFFCSELICECDYGISSLHPFLYQGKTKQDCSSTTPKDIGKSVNAGYVCGEDKL